MSVPRDEEQMPVPPVWRPTFEAVVAAFVRGDLEAAGIPGVEPLGPADQEQVRDALEDYGDVTLVELTEETWQTSVAIWAGARWDVLVDLRTAEEGRSDLVLHAHVRELGDGYTFSVHLVHVP